MLRIFLLAALTAFYAVVLASTTLRPLAAQELQKDSTKFGEPAPTSKPQTLAPVRVEARRSPTYAPGSSRTATRTPALLRDVPQAITVVNSALVRDQAMKSLGDVVRYMPGITMGQGEGNRDQLTIRGTSTTADFFVDGVRDDAQMFRDLYSVEQVEAVNGANAMVFGRGGGGGIINRVSKQPRWKTARQLTAYAGSFDTRRIEADFDQAISLLSAARLNTVFEKSGSFRNGVSNDRTGINPVVSTSTASRRTRLTFAYEYFKDERTADRGVPSFNGKPVDVEPQRFFGNADDSRARSSLNAGTVTLLHDAGRVNIRNQSRLTGYGKFYQNIYPGAVVSNGGKVTLTAYNHSIDRTNLFNQTDVTWSMRSGGIRHDVLAGAEYGSQHTDNYRETGYFGGATSALVPMSAPFYPGAVVFTQSATDADNEGRVNTSSLYLQDQVSISSALRFIGGARYERFGLRYTDNRAGSTRSRVDGMISPRVGLIFKPVEQATAYANYSVSYLPGSGDQFGSLSDITRELKPERFTNYETGFKWDILKGFSLNAAAYRIDRENTRSTNPSDPTRIVQTGAARSQGLELSAMGNITSRWATSAAIARQSAVIIRATASSPAGAYVPLVPTTTSSLWNKLEVTPSVGLGLGVVHQSQVFAAIDNKVALPAFTRVDAAAFTRVGRLLRVQVNIENLLDVRYWPTAHSNNNISPGSPRALKVSATAFF